MLRFLHLSDIHFRAFREQVSGTQIVDVDSAVRADLINDLRRLGDSVKPVDAILVVGDVAARGQIDEYRAADEFLDEVAQLIECNRTSVITVPGNHDVDRTKQTVLHHGLRRLLRTADPKEIGSLLAAIIADPVAASVLYAPFENYNRFASPIGCEMTATEPLWLPKQLALEGHPVRIRGVHSALTSDGSESEKALDSRLAVGDVQVGSLTEDDGCIGVLMCHHPSRWIRDAERLDPWFARPHILLTGHEHELGIVPHPDGRSVAIAAGAVNPELTADEWAPAYNIIELSIEGELLKISTRIRAYGRCRTGFGADDRFSDPFVLRLPLERSTPRPVEPPTTIPSPGAEELVSDERTLTYRIMIAPPDIREMAARHLGLIGQADHLDTLQDERDLLRKAQQSGQLLELAEAITQYRGTT